MNITLSANEEVIERTRAYAQEHRTSLNQLVRDFFDDLLGANDRERAADEFARNAMTHSGCSPAGYRFNRAESQRALGRV